MDYKKVLNVGRLTKKRKKTKDTVDKRGSRIQDNNNNNTGSCRIFALSSQSGHKLRNKTHFLLFSIYK